MVTEPQATRKLRLTFQSPLQQVSHYAIEIDVQELPPAFTQTFIDRLAEQYGIIGAEQLLDSALHNLTVETIKKGIVCH